MSDQELQTPVESIVTPKKASRKWTVSIAIGATVVLGGWLAANLYYMNAKEELRRLNTRRSALELQLALMNFSAINQQLPHPVARATPREILRTGKQDPSTPQLYSWRFSLAPFIDNPTREWEQDEAWSAPSNAEWRAAPNIFAYPVGDLPQPVPRDASTTTRFLAITGPDTAFGDGQSQWPKNLTDMPGDLILVVEVRNSGFHWMQPGDLDIRTMPRTINAPDGNGISSVSRRGFHVLFANGSIWFLSHDTPFEQLQKFFTIESAKKFNREEVLKEYCLDRALDPEEEGESQ